MDGCVYNMYELTVFKNQYDNKTHRKVTYNTWDEFVNALYNLSKREGHKGGPNSSFLISPAVFEPGSTRSNKTTVRWGSWCCVDVDNHPFSNNIEQLKVQLHDKLGDVDYCVYSTASSSIDKVKFRIVFRLDEPIENTRIKPFWFALNTEMEDIGDPQTKDLARMYYVPATYPGAYSFIFDNRSGTPLNTSELIAKHPYHEKTGNSFLDRLSPQMRESVISYRKNQLNNTDFRWTGYRNCPFFPRKLAAEYNTIGGTGWYRKMYQIMVAIAGNAYTKGYPITADQIVELCREFDRDTGNWYETRPMHIEADRALEYIYRNG